MPWNLGEPIIRLLLYQRINEEFSYSLLRKYPSIFLAPFSLWDSSVFSSILSHEVMVMKLEIMRKCITSLQVVLPVEGCKDFWRDGHITAVRDFSRQSLQPLIVRNKLGQIQAFRKLTYLDLWSSRVPELETPPLTSQKPWILFSDFFCILRGGLQKVITFSQQSL